MKLENEKKNIVWVLVTNCMILAVGVISAFFVPKYVSVETYAEYKTYTLYVSYLGIFHLGFNNGIYLKYGNYDYKDIPFDRFKGYTRFLVVMQLIAQIMLFGILGFFTRDNYFDTPFFYIVLNILAINVRCYYSYINLFTKRFQLDCIIQLVNNILNFSIIAILLFVKCDNYQWYLSAITIGNFVRRSGRRCSAMHGKLVLRTPVKCIHFAVFPVGKVRRGRPAAQGPPIAAPRQGSH